jgi:hypothetical protein
MGLFGNTSRPTGDAGKPRKRSAREILDEACGRNVPICVVRPQEAGRVPMARGRLLSLGDGGIDIDRVQVPGREVRFARGDELEAFFSMGQTLYQFRTTLLTLSEPKRLNAKFLIPGMSLSVPGAIDTGDRRNVFRVSVAARDDRPDVSAWRVPVPVADDEPEDGADEMPAMPSSAFNIHGIDMGSVIDRLEQPADHTGWLVDATDSGLGIRLEAVGPARFSIFDPVLLRVVMPPAVAVEAGENGAFSSMEFLAEVRSKRPVGDDGSRLGLVLIDGGSEAVTARKKNLLRRYLALVQREQLRKNRERAA